MTHLCSLWKKQPKTSTMFDGRRTNRKDKRRTNRVKIVKYSQHKPICTFVRPVTQTETFFRCCNRNHQRNGQKISRKLGRRGFTVLSFSTSFARVRTTVPNSEPFGRIIKPSTHSKTVNFSIKINNPISVVLWTPFLKRSAVVEQAARNKRLTCPVQTPERFEKTSFCTYVV